MTCLDGKEQEYYNARREAVRAYLPQLPTEATALALSGGGIRSATLSLGVLSALSKHKLVHKLDFLSTVSGGGYTGGFYGSLFVEPVNRGGARDSNWTSPLNRLDPLGTGSGPQSIQHLRENGRYLLDNAGDALRLAVIAMRSWIAIQVVIGVTVVAIWLTFAFVQAILANNSYVLELFCARHRFPPYLWPTEWLRGFPEGADVALSWLWPPVVFCLACSFMAGWAYWLTRLFSVPDSRRLRVLSGGFFATFAITVVCFVIPLAVAACRPIARFVAPVLTPIGDNLYHIMLIIGALALGALVFYITAQVGTKRADQAAFANGAGRAPPISSSEQENRVRTRLTAYATWWFTLGLVFALLATIDSAAQSLYRLYFWDYARGFAHSLKGGALLAAATPVIRRIIAMVQTSEPKGPNLRRYGQWLALAVALALVLVLGIFWAMLAHAIAWRGGPIGGGVGVMPIADVYAIPWSMRCILVPLLCFGAIAVVIGMSPGFLNLSTFGAFYAGRLRRAYLGASNPRRLNSAVRTPIEEEDVVDDIALHEYYQAHTGAPMHLINVTLNETTGRDGSALVQHDRKGRPFTVSPAGFLIGGDGTP